MLREAANLIGGIVTVTVTEGEGELTTMMIVVRDPMIERVPGTMGDAIPKGRMMSRLRAIIGAEMAPKKEDTAVVHLRLIESYLTILWEIRKPSMTTDQTDGAQDLGHETTRDGENEQYAEVGAHSFVDD